MKATPEESKAYYTELREYRVKGFVDLTAIEELEDRELARVLSRFLTPENMNHSSYNRFISNIQPLKYIFVANKTNMITTCFKAQIDTTSCIYAYLHSRHNTDNSFTHQFVTVGGALNSQDGEFRPNVIMYEQFINIFKQFNDFMEPVEQMIVDMLSKSEITYQVDFCFTENGKPKRFEDTINTSRIAIKLYQLAWFIDYHYIETSRIANHINPAYQWVIHHKKGRSTYDYIIKRFFNIADFDVNYYKFIDAFISFNPSINTDTKSVNRLKVGQKIFPISMIESIRHDDINFNVWREIYMSSCATNLVLNLISPSFPFINNWFFVQNAHGGIYDNKAMHEKFRQSEIATKVADQLRSTDQMNYVYERNKKKAQSKEFMRLSRLINRSVVYADSEIKLSNLAVCLTSEYVGRTLYDIPALTHKSTEVDNPGKFFTDDKIFMKQMFEYIYAIYSMNTKINLIHGDLHMNNVTLYHQDYFFGNNPATYKGHVAYLVNNSTYVFEHRGMYSCIIDFSRAILGDYSQIEHEFSPRFAELYFREQGRRVLYLIYHNFKKVYDEFKDNLELLIINQYPLLFKVISVVDIFFLLFNVRGLIEVNDIFKKKFLKPHPNILRFLDNVVARCERMVYEYISRMVSGNLTDLDQIEWPAQTIIDEYFSSFILSASEIEKNNIRIIDIWNYHNEVLYDIDDPDSWGPMLDLEHEAELREKYHMGRDPDLETWDLVSKTDDTVKLDDIVSKYEKEEGDVLDYADWMIK